MWVARDKNNELRLYTKKPIRWKEYNIWYVPGDNDGYSHDYELKIDQSLYIELKWEDEPIEVNLFSKDDKFKLIDSILDYINRFGLKESSTSGIYEHLFADVTEK